MPRTHHISLLFGSVLLPAVGFAGPVQDAEGELRSVYGDYRVSLFQTNGGDADATAKALESLNQKWEALSQEWTSAPPPQYADDSLLAGTMTSVDTVIDKAADEAARGDLATAHVTLEAIRSEIGDLHERNGVIGFSDRMNAYHAEMEQVLEAEVGGESKDGVAALQDAAAVLAYLAEDIAAHPAPEAADPAYEPLVDGLLKSVQALQAAAQSGDATGVKAAIAGLKPAYSKLFLKFG
ncbi:hypothetical protein [Tabrizicola sp. BL-A-41-H6]|uniref:hypothetical protein n=1 Tax=Tabrizicola sp. BL-A-41-H6 TaxID=3421107 RepID=UPI003D67A1C6